VCEVVDALGIMPLSGRFGGWLWAADRDRPRRALLVGWPGRAGLGAAPRISVPACPRPAVAIASSTARLLVSWLRAGAAPWSDAEGILQRLAREPALSRMGPPRNPGEQAAEVIRGALEASLTEPPSLSRATAGHGMHPTYLARVFRRRFGCSPGAYVHRRRIDLAVVAMARRPDLSLSALAADLGFADQSHFTRIFRRHVACTPAALARMLSSLGTGAFRQQGAA
jgi:AraC-like DNA-binding protein